MLPCARVEPGQSESPPEPPLDAASAAVPPASTAAPVPPAAAPGFRVSEWLWGSRRLAELRQTARWETAHTQQLDQRAQIAAELAARALDPAETSIGGKADAIACELYRQSIYWSLRSLEAKRSGAAASPAEGSNATLVASGELERLWALLGEGRPSLPLDDPALLERARGDFAHKTFVEFAELSPEEQTRSARELGRVADALLRVSATTRQEIDAVWFRRSLGIGAALFLLVAAVVALSFGKTWREDAADLAVGRAWRTSSTYGGVGCRSPLQSCSEGAGFFFHTLEEEKPWIELDLGSPELVSAVRLDNRSDCCSERAVPLAIEVSTDQKRFSEVSRRSENFDSWRAEFEPVPARYVRVRALRRTLLHLSRIRVFSQ